MSSFVTISFDWLYMPSRTRAWEKAIKTALYPRRLERRNVRMQFSPQLRIDAETQLAASASYVPREIFARNHSRLVSAGVNCEPGTYDDENNRRLPGWRFSPTENVAGCIYVNKARARARTYENHDYYFLSTLCFRAEYLPRYKRHFCARQNNDVLLLSRFSCSLRAFI